MNKHISAAIIVIGLLFLPIFAAQVHAYGSTLTVGDGGTYSTIQAAIDSANPGDTVEVASGTYLENITIDKWLTLSGQTDQSAVIDGNGVGNTITIVAGGVTVTGFTVINSGSLGNDSGIYLDSTVSQALVYNNVIKQNPAADGAGVTLCEASGNNLIANNTIINNAGAGICLAGASDDEIASNTIADNQGSNIFGSPVDANTCENDTIIANVITDSGNSGMLFNSASPLWIGQNTITENHNAGIELDSSSMCFILGNLIADNTGPGVVANASEASVGDNTIKNNSDGVYVNSSDSADIYANTITSNSNGIHISQSAKLDILNNDITDSPGIGINIDDSSNMEIHQNQIANNNEGIYLAGTNCQIYNNHFTANPIQAEVNPASTGNTWDNGYPTGGNYWSDYNGVDQYSGPAQNTPGSDGIGDTPYTVNLATGDIDHYPIIDPYATTTQPVNGQTVSIYQAQTTGVDLTLQGLSLQGETVTATTVNFGTTPPTLGANPILSAGAGAVYYDVKVTQDTGGPLGSDVTVTVYLTDPTFTGASTMAYWDGTSWIPVATTFTAPHTISGNIPASALTGTPITVFQGSPFTMPEYTLGALLSLFACTASFAIYKISRKKQTATPLEPQFFINQRCAVRVISVS